MALAAPCGSFPCSTSGSAVGTICHDKPYLSLSQPHWLFCPPADSFSQYSSTSACVSQLTTNETASVNLKWGPPLRARNFCPSSSKGTTKTDPFGPGPASPQRVAGPVFEFLKSE